MTNSVRYEGENCRGLSPAIWRDILKERAADPSTVAFLWRASPGDAIFILVPAGTELSIGKWSIYWEGRNTAKVRVL